MDAGYPQERHRVERRVCPDRRTGLDRRITERRVRVSAVLVERRGHVDGGHRVVRGDPEPRRMLRDRRGFTPA
jgi:hypothetical protein